MRIQLYQLQGKIEHRKTKNLGYADKYKGNHPCQESGLLQNPETDETLLEMNGGKIECCKESSTMRKIEFSTKLLDSFKICEADGGCNGSRQDVSREKQNREAISNTSEEGSAKKRMDDIDKFRYVPSTGALCCESKKDAKQKRALPASVCGKENAGEHEMESDSVRCSSGSNELTLFDVLRILTQDCYHDPILEKLTIFEAAKRRGLTFP
ncbi:hypothetical protein K2173_002816 [Erythroxylum novogranatense]|uniref:Uncharacterized protein n=1 Tax=Erythroxylum novogranatense TaxID=1862640 RepID=A0AAV8SR06_9ROSI|nr:hypothetical protein K2173_002816 [Erythroxylum novogranatense]